MATHAIKRSRRACRRATICAAAILFTTGCSSTEDTNTNFTKAINKYYNNHPSCLWPDNLNFPVQEDPANIKEIRGYDALVHQGVLVRSAAGKTPIANPQMNTYDLTSKGRTLWTFDQQKAGFGNFCYGYRTVTNIDSSTPTTSTNGATTDVIYRYSIRDVPDWAKTDEIRADFPGLQADLTSTQVGSATLTNTSIKGWQVTSAPWAHISDSDIYK